VHLNGRPFTVVGVTPEGFTGTTSVVTPECGFRWAFITK
jgi:hypothetical protein